MIPGAHNFDIIPHAAENMCDSNSKFPRQQTAQIGSPLPLSGLPEFLKNLERFFFAEASAQFWIAEDGAQDLVLHLRSPLQLLEVLHHHQQGYWGTRLVNKTAWHATRLEGLVQGLERCSGRLVDIEELSLELNDVLIVIRKSGPHSISREFDRLLQSLAAHIVYLTNGLQQMPHEIYIPALEEGEVIHTVTPPTDVSDLYGFWAVYFENEIDGYVYDLGARQTLEGSRLLYGNPRLP